MFPQKFVKNGKKFVRFKVGEEVVEAELAPRELIDEISKNYEIKLQYSFTVEPQEVEPHGKINLSGFFEAPDKEGEYEIDITIRTPGYTHMFPNVAKFQVKKEEYVVFTAVEVDQAIKAAFGERAEKALWLNADVKYYGARLADLQAVLQETKIEQLRYVAEDFDCDDYSFTLMGAFHANPYKPEKMPTAKQAIFIAWVWWKQGSKIYGHALNSAVLQDRRVVMIEPQNGRVFNVPENWNLILIIG